MYMENIFAFDTFRNSEMSSYIHPNFHFLNDYVQTVP